VACFIDDVWCDLRAGLEDDRVARLRVTADPPPQKVATDGWSDLADTNQPHLMDGLST
jgi:hypothetical protein